MCINPLPSPFPLLPSRQKGISLIELIMFIVIVSIALAGIMLVMNQVSGHSADTLVHKQALTVAESLLEEIEAQPFSNIQAAVNSVTPASGIAGYSPSAGLDITSAWNGITSGNVAQITVTVTDPAGNTYSASGYRTAY